MIADVAGGTLNSSAANFRTAVNGVDSGTDKLWRNFNIVDWILIEFITYTLNGSFESDVSVILNVTLKT